jgi:predicted  nucleic acid-binding Zn-ribbon protein
MALIQQNHKVTNSDVRLDTKMTPEQFKELYPEFYERMAAKERQNALADQASKTDSLPAGLSSGRRDVDTSKSSEKKKAKGLQDSIEEGFANIDFSSGD